MILSALSFSIMAAIVKATPHSVELKALARQIVSCIFVLLIILYHKKRIIPLKKNIIKLILRCVFGTIGIYYYFHSFDMDDHIELNLLCNEVNANGGKFMVSYDNRDEVRDIYDKYYITEIPIVYAGQLHKRDTKIELVITNYKPEAIQKSLFD